jgi:hypothetical protein
MQAPEVPENNGWIHRYLLGWRLREGMTIHPSRQLSHELSHCLADAGLPALMTVARLHGDPSERALAGIRGIRDHLLKVDVDLNALPSLQPDAIAAAVMRCDPDPEWRERILRGMTLLAMFDGSPSPEPLALLDRTATAFQVDARPVNTYRNVIQKHH